MAQKSPPVSAGRTLPHNPNAEKHVLGACIRDMEALTRTISIVEDADFYIPCHQTIYRALKLLLRKNIAIDLTTLADALEKEKKLDASGGGFYLAELAASVVTTANVEYHAKIVAERSLRRKIIRQCSNFIEEAYDSGEEAQEILRQAQAGIFRVGEKSWQSVPRKLGDFSQQVIEWVQERWEKQLKGMDYLADLPTGIKPIDDLTGGFNKDELVIIAARPAIGKTSLAQRIAENVGMRGGTSLIFSVEMGDEAVARRMHLSMAFISQYDADRGQLDNKAAQRLLTVCNQVHEKKIYIDGSTDASVETIISNSMRVKQECGGLDVVIVDFAQLLKTTYNQGTRNDELELMARDLKLLAKALGSTVILLSQLSRKAEDLFEKAGKSPPSFGSLMATIRGSGGFEQFADCIFFLMNTEEENEIISILAKFRRGPVGTAHLKFEKKYTRFLNETTEQIPF